ncbi:MAG: MotA/TolQ/ExbB proton channel family protein [Candidatus Aerophobetes bacterium]|nr:MotA/TolQ/ExbB proton channel family protein [Candidatus Aerophobetes bacterium]
MLQALIKGGWLMIPLGLCSIFALAIIIEKFISLGVIEHKADRFVKTMGEILVSDDDKKLDKIIALCEMTPSPLARILQAGIKKKDGGRAEIKEAIQDAGSLEVPYLEKHLRILGTIITISPLLGLLGTVMGMIKAFNVISVQGVGKPGALAGGIAEALLTTAVGLSIAIPSLIFYNYFSHRTDRLIRKLEEASTDFLESLVRR